ncbi:hypothetical protein BKA56DRAFT_624840 [Ilyonectria sp. MPI-CAGE-AT-0026]|nr:hypothetical protein BKA56DRAFT_624840 [Ilyonectria sp. MPI-CAGE-AT-0026]
MLGMDESNDGEALSLALDYRNWTITMWFATTMRAGGGVVQRMQPPKLCKNGLRRLRKVGFLRTENRVNVLLSRAQHGMYKIGNAETETYLHVPMWVDVHGQVAQADAIGTEPTLCCPRHPDVPSSAPN